MVILLNVSIVERLQLTTKCFNQSGDKFIQFNWLNDTTSRRDHVGTTEIDTFKAMIKLLILENTDFIGHRELHKAFFALDTDLHVSKINNSSKVSLISKKLKSTINQSLK